MAPCDARIRSLQGGITQSALCFWCSFPDWDVQAVGQGKGTGKPREARRWDVGGLGRSIPSPLPPEESAAWCHLPGRVNPVPRLPPVCIADAASEVTGSQPG